MPDYIDIPVDTNPETIADESFQYLQQVVPGWAPAEGGLETIVLNTAARQASTTRSVATRTPRSIFRFFGKLVDVDEIVASKAIGTADWHSIDTAGHDIPAGTQVGIGITGDITLVYEVMHDVSILPGQDHISNVPIIALETGTAYNDAGELGQQLSLVTPLQWIDFVSLSSIPTGGTDAETDDEYLNRLAAELSLLSPRPILPRDFVILARKVPGVFRAVAVDGYDPDTDSYFNERMVTLAAVDEAGVPVSAPVRQEMQDYLDGLREVNFVVKTTDPTINLIDVVYTVVSLPGTDRAALKDLIDSALIQYLDSATWGKNAGDSRSWDLVTVVRYNKITQVILNVQGVDYIDSLLIGLHGGGIGTADILLSGPAPLADVYEPIAGTVN